MVDFLFLLGHNESVSMIKYNCITIRKLKKKNASENISVSIFSLFNFIPFMDYPLSIKYIDKH